MMSFGALSGSFSRKPNLALQATFVALVGARLAGKVPHLGHIEEEAMFTPSEDVSACSNCL
jgi:hypothetical protein